MSSKRRIRERSCTRKIRYPTDDAAYAARRSLSRRGEAHINVYHCKFCGGWHVGHTPIRCRRGNKGWSLEK